MGIETVDVPGSPVSLLSLFPPDVSVINPAHADTLLSSWKFMEAGYRIVSCIPSQVKMDIHAKNHGGNTGADSRIVLIEYKDETRRLPLPSCKRKEPQRQPVHVSNTYAPL